MLKQLDVLRVLALTLWAVPIIFLLPLGVLWLRENGVLLHWLWVLLAFSGIGYGLQYWCVKQDRERLGRAKTTADPHWPLSAEKAWNDVETFADSLQPTDWPFATDSVLELGKKTLSLVARRYYPDSKQPLLELTIPHTLLVIEKASGDLRTTVLENVPFSHRLHIGDLGRLSGWKEKVEHVFDIYRLGRLVLNPAAAVLQELKGILVSRTMDSLFAEMYCWLLREYVRKVGYYAVQLYGGQLTPHTESPKIPSADKKEAETITSEPLRIVVLGRSHAGKSRLINILFGELRAASDVIDNRLHVQAYRLIRDGLEPALIFDTPGYHTETPDEKAIHTLVEKADLILWVCRATQADRAVDKAHVDTVRTLIAQNTERPSPPCVVAVTHIDQLKPAQQWTPPYDLSKPQVSLKAANIRAAMEAIATDLDVAVDTVVPVCLAEERIYNVDALWAVIVTQKKAAERQRYLRCLEVGKRAKNWDQVRAQFVGVGQLLLGKLP